MTPDGRVRLLHFTDSRDTSGYFVQLARFANKERFDVLFGALRSAEHSFLRSLDALGVPTLELGAPRALYPIATLQLARWLRRERVDILHAHLFEPSVIGLTAAKLARTRARLLTRHYSDYHTRLRRPLHVALDRLTTRLAEAVIAVSEHTARHLVDVEAAPKDKVHTILNGVDFARLRLSAPNAPKRLRHELGGESCLLLLLPARLHPEKGHTYLFQALERLLGRLPRPIMALIAGDGPFRSAYESEVRARRLDACVRFLGFREDMSDLMAAADAVVLPSVAEAFGLVLVEALYLRRPVVATRLGGIPEIIEDGVNGILVAPADAEALARAITSLACDEALRERLASGGRDGLIERYGFAGMMRRYERLYESVLASRA